MKKTEREKLKKYHLFFDNFFTSPDLMIHLQKIGLAATGTVRQNRVKAKIDMPKKQIEEQLFHFTMRIQN